MHWPRKFQPRPMRRQIRDQLDGSAFASSETTSDVGRFAAAKGKAGSKWKKPQAMIDAAWVTFWCKNESTRTIR